MIAFFKAALATARARFGPSTRARLVSSLSEQSTYSGLTLTAIAWGMAEHSIIPYTTGAAFLFGLVKVMMPDDKATPPVEPT